jgi:hypothetical protein
MKASTNSPENRSGDWPHPSLCRRSWPLPGSDRDEHSQTGILTPGFNLVSAFPMDLPSVALPAFRWCPEGGETCIPLQWRNRPRFTRGSLTPGCIFAECAEHSVVFKEQRCDTFSANTCQANSCGLVCERGKPRFSCACWRPWEEPPRSESRTIHKGEPVFAKTAFW